MRGSRRVRQQFGQRPIRGDPLGQRREDRRVALVWSEPPREPGLGSSELTEQAELKRVIVDDGQRQNAGSFRSVIMRLIPKFLVVKQRR